MLISAGQIISKSIALYRDNARLFFRYLALLFVPNVLMFAFTASSRPESSELPSFGMGLVWFVLFVVVYLVMMWITIAFVRAIFDRYEGREALNPKQELQQVAPLLKSTIWVVILSGLAAFGGFILLIIPGIIFSIWFAFSMYTAIFDGQKGAAALRMSKKLVQGRWWGVFWRLFAPGVVYAVIILSAQGILALASKWVLASFENGSTTQLVSNVILGLLLTIVTLLITPFSTAAPTILYSELKKTSPAPTPTPAATT